MEPRRTRIGIALAVFGGLAFGSGVARANPGINGYSGKPVFGSSDTCDSKCHKATSPTPTLTITVPSTVQAGSTNDLKVVIDGTRARTSIDLAFSDGVTLTKGKNTQIPFPTDTPWEAVAVTPPPSGADGTYQVSFTAPKQNGTIKLWIAGMSASGSGTGGDGVAKATRTITVTGGTTGSDAGTTEPDDAGAVGPDDAGSTAGGDEDGATDEPDDESSSGSRATRRPSNAGDGGCALGSRPDAGSGILLGLASTIALVALRRRRRYSADPAS